MTSEPITASRVDRAELRLLVQEKYEDVAEQPERGFHFHNGRPLAEMLGYAADAIDALPQGTVDSFAGTGNPFSMGALNEGETVLDLGCGAGFDTLQAARQVGPAGQVVAIDMTAAMLAKTRAGAAELGFEHVEVRLGYAESLPLEDASVDVVISNVVINLCPDKVAVMKEIARVLRPGGRIQIADIFVQRPVDQEAKDDIELWSG